MGKPVFYVTSGLNPVASKVMNNEFSDYYILNPGNGSPPEMAEEIVGSQNGYVSVYLYNYLNNAYDTVATFKPNEGTLTGSVEFYGSDSNNSQTCIDIPTIRADDIQVAQNYTGTFTALTPSLGGALFVFGSGCIVQNGAGTHPYLDFETTSPYVYSWGIFSK